MKLSNQELAEIYIEISKHPRFVNYESLNKLAQHINYFEDRVNELERIIKESPTLSMYQDVVEQLAERDALIEKLHKELEYERSR